MNSDDAVDVRGLSVGRSSRGGFPRSSSFQNFSSAISLRGKDTINSCTQNINGKTVKVGAVLQWKEVDKYTQQAVRNFQRLAA